LKRENGGHIGSDGTIGESERPMGDILRSLHPLSFSYYFLFRSHSSPSSPPHPPSPRHLDLLLLRRLPPPLLSPLPPPPHRLLKRRSPRQFLHSNLLINPPLQSYITVAIAFSSLIIAFNLNCELTVFE